MNNYIFRSAIEFSAKFFFSKNEIEFNFIISSEVFK